MERRPAIEHEPPSVSDDAAWEAPAFSVIKMDAEIGSYQESDERDWERRDLAS